MLQRRPDTDNGYHYQQTQQQWPGQRGHLAVQLILGLHNQPGAAQQRIGQNQAHAAEQRKRRQPRQLRAAISTIGHFKAVDERPEYYTLAEGRQE